MAGLEDVANLKPREVIALAKKWVNEVFQDEQIDDVGLEEVRYSRGEWKITIGFSRPWSFDSSVIGRMTGAGKSRAYKVVSIDDQTKEITSLSNREAA